MSSPRDRRRLGAVAFGALAVVPLAPGVAAARPIGADGEEGVPPTSRPDLPRTADSAEHVTQQRRENPSDRGAVARAPAPPTHAPSPVSQGTRRVKPVTSTPRPAPRPAAPSPVARRPEPAPTSRPDLPRTADGAEHVVAQRRAARKPTPRQADADSRPTTADAPRAKRPLTPRVPAAAPTTPPTSAPSPVSQGTQAVPPAPTTTPAPTPVVNQPSVPTSRPDLPRSADGAEHTVRQRRHAAARPLGRRPATPPVPTGAPSPVTRGTRAVPPAPVAEPDPTPTQMQPRPSDGPGERGGELPGAGIPKTGKTDDGPSIKDGLGWVRDRTVSTAKHVKKWAYERPHCIEGSYYDEVGGGAGLCVDLKGRRVKPTVEFGAGAGGNFKISSPDHIEAHSYSGVGAAGSAGPAGGHVELRVKDHGDRAPRKSDLYTDADWDWGVPWRTSKVGPDGVERSPSDGKHTGKAGRPGWTKNGTPTHRGTKPTTFDELFKKGNGKWNVQGKVYVTRGWVFDW